MDKATILVADDDRQMLDLMKLHLEHAGHQVVCVQDAYFALAKASREKPDLIVLDVNMPCGNGFSVQERLNKMTELAGVPVIYVTGDRSDQVASASRCLGAFALIHKPFDADDLIDKVHLALTNNAAPIGAA